jgi:subtilisin family serine protease
LAAGSFMLAAEVSAAPLRTTPSTRSFVPGRVLVVVDDTQTLGIATNGVVQSGEFRVAETLTSLGIGHGRALGAAGRLRAASAPRFYALESAQPGFDPLAAAAALRATGRFRAVCPDYRVRLLNTIPNDFYLPTHQWFINDGGFADIRLPGAWDTERGDPSVVLAIMDTGVDTSNPDLASQIWHNLAEVPGNSVDDDGNGLVDDIEGWDFANNDKDPKPEALFEVGVPADIGFHGTFCAGLAAAATDNGEGIAGAGWHCRIMPLKVSNQVDGLSSSAITEAFEYAADQGAAVISMSFGGPGDPGVPEYFQALVDMATAAGSLCVAAAGNDDSDALFYPAACNDVIAVAATNASNARASFSNWGPWVDVAAPGSGMWSTIATNYVVDDVSLSYYRSWGWDGTHPYMSGDGTSFACPLAAGVCGLILSKFPYMTPQAVALRLVSSGDVVVYDHPIGPRVNALAAVTPAPVAVEPVAGAWEVRLSGASPNPFTDGCEVDFTLATDGPARLAVFDVSGRCVRELASGTLAAGPHRERWDGHDGEGRDLGSGVYLVRLDVPGGSRERKLVRLGR